MRRIRVVSWNVNGLRAVLRRGWPEMLSALQPDIVCLQEVKAFAKDVPTLAESAPGYTFFWGSSTRPGYSGVATFVKASLKFDAVPLPDGDPLLYFADEGRVLITRSEGLTVYNLYFPSGTSGDSRQRAKYRFLRAFKEHLDRTNPTRVVFCGDFNICHRDIDIHHPREAERRKLSGFLPRERAFMDELCRSGLVDSYRAVHGDLGGVYSWWTYRAGARGKNLGWRIDYCFITPDLRPLLRDAGLHPELTGSDHCPARVDLKLNFD